VRANSNSQIDQQIKYEVKDKVVEYITPYVAQCVTKDKAMEIIGGILPQIEEVCDSALAASGFTYKSRAQIKSENFPTRVYGDVTLEQGVYDALIIELGSGTGDNWWCVIYPPLCFTSTTASVQYRSAIYDIIKKFFA
jgi:stage II sporulation protein R